MIYLKLLKLFTECGDRLSDAGSLAWRLAEALPLSLDEQQQLLEEEKSTPAFTIS